MTWVYFTDRDLGKQFPAILSQAGLAVERHADLFPHDGSDEQWLEHCGRNGRVAISHNSRIRYVPNELAAVVRFKVSLIIVVDGQIQRDAAARAIPTSTTPCEMQTRGGMVQRPRMNELWLGLVSGSSNDALVNTANL